MSAQSSPYTIHIQYIQYIVSLTFLTLLLKTSFFSLLYKTVLLHFRQQAASHFLSTVHPYPHFTPHCYNFSWLLGAAHFLSHYTVRYTVYHIFFSVCPLLFQLLVRDKISNRKGSYSSNSFTYLFSSFISHHIKP